MNATEIGHVLEEALTEGRTAATADAIEGVRVKYLGRNGLLPKIMKGLKDLPPAERGEAGRVANRLKDELTTLLDATRCGLGTVADTGPVLDVTLPGCWRGLGARHPVSLVIEEAARIFYRIGFTVAEGPDVETAYRNFEALNTPAHHPSLDPQDTFWLESGELLRTQTSPVWKFSMRS